MRVRTDDEAITFDVAALLAVGRFTEALVPAALQADRLEVIPRSLTFLAEIVRRGGVAYAARLAEPLPTPEQTELVRPWLAEPLPVPEQTEPLPAPEQTELVRPLSRPSAPASPPGWPAAAGVDDERLARWLDGVAAIIEARRLTAR